MLPLYQDIASVSGTSKRARALSGRPVKRRIVIARPVAAVACYVFDMVGSMRLARRKPQAARPDTRVRIGRRSERRMAHPVADCSIVA